MQRGRRVLKTFDPELELADRWPSWRIVAKRVPGPPHERFDVANRTVLYSSDDKEWALAHILAHLDLGHHTSAADRFLPSHEADADLLAAIRLDLVRWGKSPTTVKSDEWDDVPMDGEPSQSL